MPWIVFETILGGSNRRERRGRQKYYRKKPSQNLRIGMAYVGKTNFGTFWDSYRFFSLTKHLLGKIGVGVEFPWIKKDFVNLRGAKNTYFARRSSKLGQPLLRPRLCYDFNRNLPYTWKCTEKRDSSHSNGSNDTKRFSKRPSSTFSHTRTNCSMNEPALIIYVVFYTTKTAAQLKKNGNFNYSIAIKNRLNHVYKQADHDRVTSRQTGQTDRHQNIFLIRTRRGGITNYLSRDVRGHFIRAD